jgi:hypothetical protein
MRSHDPRCRVSTMRLWLAILAAAMLLPGCAGCGDDGNTPKNPEAGIDAAQPVTYGTFVKVTFPSALAVPMPPQLFATSTDIDTTASSFCDTVNDKKDDYCVVVGSTISVAAGAAVTAHGAKPLILLATSELDLDGTIDVSSKHGGMTGAGAATASQCAGNTEATGHSGGYGGSFGGKGGAGGQIAGAGELGGTAVDALPAFPTTLRGGCPGGNGAKDATGGGAGGSGGGAVMVFSPTIQFNGTINASGAGGSGGPTDAVVSSGGGGGGAGGLIVIEATTITPGTATNLWLFATGGGGGQGGTGGVGAGAGAGDDGKESQAPATAALAGNNTNLDGGRGGTGSAASARKDGSPAGPSTGTGGGGAGGGGAGFIRTPSITGAMVAPPPG